jgi:hypothetical protein
MMPFFRELEVLALPNAEAGIPRMKAHCARAFIIISLRTVLARKILTGAFVN